MKVLWVCNSPLKHFLNGRGENGTAASWIEGIFEDLRKNNEYTIAVCFPYGHEYETSSTIVENTVYYTLPMIKRQKHTEYIAQYKKIYDMERPDIIHIWGSEFTWILDAVIAAEQKGLLKQTVLNLQGICSAISNHYYADLPRRVIYTYSLRDLIRRDNIKRQRDSFRAREKYEDYIFRKLHYVIGRTDYDYAYSTMKNPQLKYFVCNETLRQIFYDNKWKYEDCCKHRILLSQGYYPLKGVHYVIEALEMVKERYPDVELIIAGPDILRVNDKMGILRRTTYANYLKKMIKRKKLVHSIKFIGSQSEEEMCQQYLKSNLFISPSSTENESNSLGEAKLLGMPVIASFVGGVGNRIKHREDGLAYQHNDVVMLARFICDIFDDPVKAIEYGENARENEMKIVNKKKNINQLLEIYKAILVGGQ